MSMSLRKPYPPLGPNQTFLHSRTPSRSPTRAPSIAMSSHTDDLASLLSEATLADDIGYFAARDPPGLAKLKAGLGEASSSELSFAVRAVKTGKHIREWCLELEGWEWPGSPKGFEVPGSEDIDGRGYKRRRLDGNEDVYCGALRAEDVRSHRRRVESIRVELDDLEFEELKDYVLESQVLSRSRPELVWDIHDPEIERERGGMGYMRIDDLTAAITAVVLEALPLLARLEKGLSTWRTRLAVLKRVPDFLEALEDARVAMDSAWNAVGHFVPGDNASTASHAAPSHLSREALFTIRKILEEKVSSLGKNLDHMLDMLEGRDDCVPDGWIDEVEHFEHEFADWVVEGERVVVDNEWRARRNPKEKKRVILDMSRDEQEKTISNEGHETFPGETMTETQKEADLFMESVVPDPRPPPTETVQEDEVRQDSNRLSLVERIPEDPQPGPNLSFTVDSPAQKSLDDTIPTRLPLSPIAVSSIRYNIPSSPSSPAPSVKSIPTKLEAEGLEELGESKEAEKQEVIPLATADLVSFGSQLDGELPDTAGFDETVEKVDSSQASDTVSGGGIEVEPPMNKEDIISSQTLTSKDSLQTSQERVLLLASVETEKSLQIADSAASVTEVPDKGADEVITETGPPEASASLFIDNVEYLSPPESIALPSPSQSESALSDYLPDNPSPEIISASAAEYFKPREVTSRPPSRVVTPLTTPIGSLRRRLTEPDRLQASPLPNNDPEKPSQSTPVTGSDAFESIVSHTIAPHERAGGETGFEEGMPEQRPSFVKRASITSIELLSASDVKRIDIKRNPNSDSLLSTPIAQDDGQSVSRTPLTDGSFSSSMLDPEQFRSAGLVNDIDASPSLRKFEQKDIIPPAEPEIEPSLSSPTVSLDEEDYDQVAEISPGPTKISFKSHVRHASEPEDVLDQKISSILDTIPANIQLRSKPEPQATSNPGNLRVSKSRKSEPTPVFTLAPAFPKSGSNSSIGSSKGRSVSQTHNAPKEQQSLRRPPSIPQLSTSNSDIKLYHLHRPGTSDAPIKLFVRLVGERGERVMVRVGGGWANLGEYLREWVVHHGGRRVASNDSNVEISTITPNGPSGRHNNASRAGTPVFGGRPGSAIGDRSADRPVSSLSFHKARPSSRPTTPYASHKNSPAATAGVGSPEGSVFSAGSARSSSRMSWNEDADELGMAGPRARKRSIGAGAGGPAAGVDKITPEKRAWVEGVLGKVRAVSGSLGNAEKEKDKERNKAKGKGKKKESLGASLIAGGGAADGNSRPSTPKETVEFGNLGKVGGVNRVFVKNR